jgi:hypothetical protein
MPAASGDTSQNSIAGVLKAAEIQLEGELRGLKQVKAALADACRKLEKQPSSRKTLEQVLDRLQTLSADATGPASAAFATVLPKLQQRLQQLSSELERDLRDALKSEAQQAGFDFGMAAGAMFLGPFALRLDFAREAASLEYATVPIGDKLPLDAVTIVTECQKQAALILDRPRHAEELASLFEQAIRVAVVRTGQNPTHGELRAELPAVYREMVYLQQLPDRPPTKVSFRDYPLARFVVELKTFIQSDENLASRKRFRLETAVIDNTRNRKKSVFVPNDVRKGYGEGMYFQALVMLAQG